MFQNELDYSKVKEVFWTDARSCWDTSTMTHAAFTSSSRIAYSRLESIHLQINGITSSPSSTQLMMLLVDRRQANLSRTPDGSADPRFYKSHAWRLERIWSVKWRNKSPTGDKEVRKTSTFVATVAATPSLLQRLECFSNWHRAKRALAVCLRHREILLTRIRKRKLLDALESSDVNQKFRSVTVEEMRMAEQEIIKMAQNAAFSKELEILKGLKSDKEVQDRKEIRRRNQTMRKTSTLLRLDPFLDENGIMRVGRRIRRASISEEVKHPVVLPRKGHTSELVIRYFHERIEHQGRRFTLNEIRSSGYWIIGCSSAVASLIKKCVKCQRLRASVQTQKMADFPKERFEALHA